jgi:hypothetical protein
MKAPSVSNMWLPASSLLLQMKLPDSWTSVNMGTYLGTIGFAYLCFVMFILFFFALVIFQGAVTQELGLPPVRPVNPYAKMQGDMLLYPYAVGMQVRQGSCVCREGGEVCARP